MKAVPVIIGLLLAAGLGGLIYLSIGAGAAKAGVTVREIVAGGAEGGRMKLPVQVVRFHSEFKPVVFDAIDIVPEGQAPSLEAPRLRVRYEGDDKLALEPYSHVSIEGTWDKDAGIFHASKMTTQCPSHYENAGKPPVPQGAMPQARP